MTKDCGCEVKNPPCNRLHVDLDSNTRGYKPSLEEFEKLVTFVQTTPLDETLLPTAALLAAAKK